MKIRIPVLLTAFVLALPVPGLFAAEPAPAKTTHIPGREIVKTVAATIEAINFETREITLKGRLGNVFTVTAEPQIVRLNEFKVGDEIVLDYSISLAAEIRPPTAEEKAKPYVVTENAAKTPATASPGVEGYRIIEAVVTIEGLDRQTQTVTIKGPKGNYATIKVKDPTTIEKLKQRYGLRRLLGIVRPPLGEGVSHALSPFFISLSSYENPHPCLLCRARFRLGAAVATRIRRRSRQEADACRGRRSSVDPHGQDRGP